MQKSRGDKKKLSWIYRRKTKLQKSKKVVESDKNDKSDEDKKPRIIVRNLSFKATKDDIKTLYEPFGQIEEINIPNRSDGKPVGCCFIQFANLTDASKAIFNTNKKEFLGRVINSSWAISKSKYCEKIKEEKIKEESVENRDDTDNDTINKDSNKTKLDKERSKEDKVATKKEESVHIKKERRKKQKRKHKNKRARIVIRNVSFEATDEKLREHFSQYGAIEDIKILKRKDGKHVGCAFLQFEHVQSAAKAIHYANMQPLLGRPVVVDWAVPKNKFSTNNSENVETDEVKVKIEKESDTEDQSVIKIEKESDEEVGSEDEEQMNGTNESDESDESDECNDEILTDVEIKSEDESIESEDEEEQDVKDVKRPRFESHDVSEGKTVFLKNVPFSVKNEQLKKYIERFGPVYYALVCIDPLTEFSKGTAFVKFKNVEDAEKCLSAGTELQMDDQVIEAQRALDRNELQNKPNNIKEKHRDSRNLYLVKEGVILAGSSAAVGLSATDMAKRLKIEQWKSQILRNLNMFVSRERLVVHNLPVTVDDVKLRKIFEHYGPPKAIIKEARVMRDLKKVDAKGVGISKEYGFVSYTNHEDALEALRTINNNPNVFTPNRRPIISFSIENRVMVNAKRKRLEKSREQNPLWPESKAKGKEEVTKEEVPAKKLKTETTDKGDKIPYAGMVGKPSENKFRSRYKLKTQATIHHESMKKEKKMKKSSKKLEAKKRERMKKKSKVEPQKRTKVKSDDANIDKLVNKYRNKMKSAELKKSKWYEA